MCCTRRRSRPLWSNIVDKETVTFGYFTARCNSSTFDFIPLRFTSSKGFIIRVNITFQHCCFFNARVSHSTSILILAKRLLRNPDLNFHPAKTLPIIFNSKKKHVSFQSFEIIIENEVISWGIASCTKKKVH